MLVLVCGLPGTGKTTVAKRIAEETKSTHLNTDIIRKDILADPKYTEEEKEMIYNLLFNMAEKLLSAGSKVVIDGTFYRKELRDKVRSIAEKTKKKFRMVEVTCAEDILKERIEKRKKNESFSDADFDIYLKIKEQFEPIKEKHTVLMTDRGWEPVEKFIKSL